MKIFFAIAPFFFFSCSHQQRQQPKTQTTIEKIEINFSKIESNKDFTKLTADRYQITLGPESEIKLLRFAFKNQQQLKSYLLNRRLFLESGFQDHTAPYIGKVETEPNCVKAANLKAELKKNGQNSEYFFMEFPVTNTKAISDCVRDDVWGMIRYVFYNCKKQNELFEVRYIKSLKSIATEIQMNCGN